jgi:hypothetical protein
MNDRQKKAEGGDKGAPDAGQAAPRQRFTPGQQKTMAFVRAATQYNEAHKDQVADFNKLTGGACAGGNAGVDAKKVRDWQLAHGLPGDGKIGPQTLMVASRDGGKEGEKADGKEGGGEDKKPGAAGGEKSDVTFSDKEAGTVEGKAGGAKSDVTFSDKEAGTVEGKAGGGKGKAGGGKGKNGGQKSDVTFGDNAAADPMAAEAATAGDGEKSDVTFDDNAAGNPMAAGGGLADDAVAGGETGGEEKRPEEKEDPSEVGGGLAKEGAEKIGEDMAGEGHGVAVGAAARLALVPHIVNLLRAHKFGDAVKYVLETISFQERAEILKAVAEKIGSELSEHALAIFEHACFVGLIADVLKAGWEWTYGGIKAVQEAHEAGDRDSRIGIYAWAWSDCVLKGSHDNPGAVDEEQRKAMKLGMEDGLATRDQSPELAFLLIAEYGSESNARHALEDALLKRAGISGIKTHAGK